MSKQLQLFLVRWLLNSLGLWIAVRLVGDLGAELTSEKVFWTFATAGLVFSVANTVLKPLVVILSLPAILLTLGLFYLVVNGFMVWVTLKLVPGIEMPFYPAILAGIIMSLVNYVITGLSSCIIREKSNA